MFNSILRAGLLLSLVVYLPYMRRMDNEEIVAGFGLLLVLGFALSFKPRRHVSLHLLALAFIAIVGVSACSLKFPVWRMLVNLALGISVIKIIAERFDFQYYRLGKTLFIYALVSNVWIVLQCFGVMFYYGEAQDQIAGVSAMPWIMGVSAVLCLPFIFKFNKWACLSLLPMLYFSHSIATVAVALVIFAYLMNWLNRKTVVYSCAVVFALVAIYFYAVEKNLDADRVLVWKRSLQYQDNVITGNGYGTWAHTGFIGFNGRDSYLWRWAHNEFYQHFFETGIIGTLALGLWIFSLFRIRDRTAKAALFALLFECFWHPVLHWPRLVFISIFIIGIAEAEKTRLSNETNG